MKIFLLLSTILLFNCIEAKKRDSKKTCPDLEDSIIGTFLDFFSDSSAHKNTKFYLGLKNTTDHALFEKNDWSLLKNKKNFSPFRKTYFIIHGYMSSAKKNWIKGLTTAFLEKESVNIILVDWADGSYKLNFVDSVRITQQVTEHIYQFLQDMKVEVGNFNNTSGIKWNQLYFIGQSLGAHISGQVGYTLKQKDDFFKVERITGLDPAKPCFVNAENHLKLDKTDADFVDIIHTQTGKTNKGFSFGMRIPTGHMDFYVNGGVMQPECDSNSILLGEIKDMQCSHKSARKYFTESVVNSDSDVHKFKAFSWDRTYDDAKRILKEAQDKTSCVNCPEMGYNAVKYNKPGTYLVLTSTTEPYYEFGSKDAKRVKTMLKLLKKT